MEKRHRCLGSLNLPFVFLFNANKMVLKMECKDANYFFLRRSYIP